MSEWMRDMSVKCPDWSDLSTVNGFLFSFSWLNQDYDWAIHGMFPAFGVIEWMKSLRALCNTWKPLCVSVWCHWTPGPPDVEQPCDPSLQAWSPELSLYDTNVTSPCPDTEGCTLTLRFLHPMVPHALTLWVTYISLSKCNLRKVNRRVNHCIAPLEQFGGFGPC